MKEMKSSPIAEIFPMMSREEIAELAKDIKANGLRQKIVLDMPDGAILDGRNRYAACKIAGVKPEFEVYAGNDPIGYVLSLNLARRHLSEVQRAEVATNVATLRKGSNQHVKKEDAHVCASSNTRANANDSAKTDAKTLKQAAAEVGVSARAVQQARKIKETAAPELVEAMRQGDVSLRAAEKIAAKPVEVQKKIIAAEDPAKALKEAEAKDDGAPKKDRAGNPLPDVPSVTAAFKTGAEGFDQALTYLNQFVRVVNSMKDQEGKPGPIGSRHLNSGDHHARINVALKELRGVLMDLRPYGVCTYCRGKGKDHYGTCKPCAGEGWLTERKWKSTPEADRNALKTVK